LEFDVTRDRGGQQSLSVVRDFDGEDEQTPPASDNASSGGESAGAYWAQVMNGEIGGGYAFTGLELCYHREGRGRIDQRSNRASMDDTLVLLHLVANGQVDGRLARAYLAKFETE
jgi:hypothetical protein